MVNCAQDKVAQKMQEVVKVLDLVWGQYVQLQDEDTLNMAEVDMIVPDVMEQAFPDSMDYLNFEQC